MKRTLIFVLILLIAVVSLVGANTASLSIYGKIVSDISFTTSTDGVTFSEAAPLDLSATELASDGVGVYIGSWTYARTRGGALSYNVSYTYSPLSAGTSTLDYELLIDDGTTVTPVSSTGVTNFNVGGGAATVSRDVSFRFTAAGVTALGTADASDEYTSDILLELIQI